MFSIKTASAEDSRPNIVYIMLDEWGYYEMSSLGHPLIETPNIDQLASEGMRFTQFLAGANVCAPTRATLILGQHTGHTSVRYNSGATPIKIEDITIAQVLKQAGYATGGFGKWGLGDRGTSGVPELHGFDIFFGYYHQVHAHTYFPNYLLKNSRKVPLKGNTGHAFKGETFSQYLIHEEAKKFIRQNAGKQPFFAYLPYTLPHAYYGIPEDDPAYLKYKDRDWDAPPHHFNPEVAPPDEAQRYAAFMSMADRLIGEILYLLKETGIEENTIVFLSGDNGANTRVFVDENHPNGFFVPNTNPKTGKTFRGGKGNFYEGGLRVACMVKWPGKIKAGMVSNHLGYFPDVMPTIAELTGIEIPKYTDGISFLPTLLGEPPGQQKQHDYLYWEDAKQVAVRYKNWKAIKISSEAAFELYNLTEDIEEQYNIADIHPEIIKKIEQFANEAHTPHVHGEIYDKSLGFKGHKAK
jgi:arylsulfatase A-like enzyme